MNVDDFLNAEFNEHADVLSRTRAAVAEPFGRLLDASVQALKNGGKLAFFGNGGSAADAQHLATELTVRYVDDRPAIPAIALTTDSSTLTAIGNDYGFERLFARQVEALCRPGDVVIGISTSGRSQNVIDALRQARDQGCVAAAFGGKDGGPMADVANPCLVVPSETTARIQEMHILIGQALCSAIERELGYVA
ncbi:MAG: D-sedoheptulose 7-phosphate isomerase [Rhodospirillales bacterium]